MIRVAIIIVNWNGARDTINCLRSISKLELEGISTSVVVIDNASTDTSTRQIENLFPEVILHKNNVNKGFATANNQGMRYSFIQKFDYVWLLNNDTRVSPKSLSFLVQIAKNTQGIIGSKIYFAPGHEYHMTRYSASDRGKVLWYAGGIIDWKNMYASHKGVDEIDTGQYDDPEETDFVTGCSMLISRKILETVGYLDEKFFMYYEDVDYCIRAKEKKISVIYQPYSVVWHCNAGSSGGPGNKLHQYYQTRNRLLVGIRYAPLRTKLALLRESFRFLHEDSIRSKAIKDALIGSWGKQL